MHAVKFAVAHNQHVRAKKTRKGAAVEMGETFDFNGKGGKLEWTVLHHAIYHTNLAMITYLLSCNEKLNLASLDQ
jgi:hypothetical protein